MTPKDSLEKAAETYGIEKVRSMYFVSRHEAVDEFSQSFKAGAEWQEYQCTNHGVDLMNERDKLKAEIERLQGDLWKSEYQNLCKFANDYEEQRDAWKKQAEALAEAMNQIKEKSISDLPLGTWMFWRAIASEALKAFEEFKKSGK